MPHRRKGRRYSLVPLDPALRQPLLKLARAARAHTPAALDALLDPRRTAPPAKGCAPEGRR